MRDGGGGLGRKRRLGRDALGLAAGADAGAGPSLRDLLGASSELYANDDPGLEDPLEFFMVSYIIMQSKLNY